MEQYTASDPEEPAESTAPSKKSTYLTDLEPLQMEQYTASDPEKPAEPTAPSKKSKSAADTRFGYVKTRTSSSGVTFVGCTLPDYRPHGNGARVDRTTNTITLGTWIEGTVRSMIQSTVNGGLTVQLFGQRIRAQKSPDGELYLGMLKDNIPHGRGQSFQPADGTYFDGNFVNGKRHGKGNSATTSATYIGNWQYGRQDGFGQYTTRRPSEDGTETVWQYEGLFKNNLPHGQGKLVPLESPSAGLCCGIFEAGNFVGPGYRISPDGTSRYQGMFRGGELNGPGTCDRGGVSYRGHWANGTPLGEFAVHIKDPPMKIYTGLLNNELNYNGYGHFTCSSTKKVYSGTWAGGCPWGHFTVSDKNGMIESRQEFHGRF